MCKDGASAGAPCSLKPEPTPPPVETPPPGPTGPAVYEGCYLDDSKRNLKQGPGPGNGKNSGKTPYNTETCGEKCKQFTFFALQVRGARPGEIHSFINLLF